jgi:hypothetical protein
MSGIAIAFFVIAAVLVWGGLAASIIFLARRPEVASYPDGGTEDDRDEDEL